MMSALMYASRHGLLSVVNLLIEAGANLDLCEKTKGWTVRSGPLLFI